jgi:hypothetical protein
MPKTLPKLSWLPDFEGRRQVYRPLSKTRQEIRVLEVFGNSDRSAPLHCILRTISVREKGVNHYHALSYYWGSTLDLDVVTVHTAPNRSIGLHATMADAKNAFHIPITKSLAAALRQFRDSHQAADGPLILWTDAICINQLDPDERAQQVAIMRTIYVAATSVWVWLGDADRQVEKGLLNAFALARHLGCKAFDNDNNNIKLDSTLVERAVAGVKDPTQTVELHELVLSVGALAGLPYWYRGWTIQEATANSTVRLQYGLTFCHVLNWGKLVSCLDGLFYPLIFHLRHQEPLTIALAHLHSWTSTQTCYATSESFKDYLLTEMVFSNAEFSNAPDHVSLSLTVLGRSNHWQTADQRDRVYALVGAMGGFTALDLKPNYRNTVEDLFKKATVQLLTVGQSWSHLQFFYPSASPFLPSWAIDFTRCINMENYASVNLLYNHSKRWKAAGDSKIRVRQGRLCSSSVLHTAGFLFDEIIAISDYRSPRRPNDIYDQKADAWLDLWREHRYYVRDKAKYFSEDLGHVCYRTWCGGMVDDEEFGPHHIESAQDESSGQCLPLSQAINNQFKNRRFVITKQGYVGLVPDTSQVGDRVGILASGSMPFVLRKVETPQVRGDAYILIGGCYVDGKLTYTPQETGRCLVRHEY